MHFSSFPEFLAMGGYGSYVWWAFGITLVSMLWLVVSALLTRRKLFQEIKNKVAREQRIKKAENMENTL
ncbi:heme exporter protein CcmD [Enterovibrio nigricans]|uniref:Heme exporter protein D n=1 Tax=Enterovibrio nigricans DSM 22720 TaxID=1121868 RepID=A0A1T4U7X1_9GAMM|nr:heme exporter protein CcmD [Enterovibrio nigricans]PKF51752.1 heme exporter protein CcmD [Enterovibrio nigricans]SKA48638.1 heme exporter protein D [Enterovibrio nigricans DSM 22720]